MFKERRIGPRLRSRDRGSVEATVAERKRTMPERILRRHAAAQRDRPRSAAKLAEECGESIKAAREQTSEHLTKELCDVLLHAMVLMADKGITLVEVENETREASRNFRPGRKGREKEVATLCALSRVRQQRNIPIQIG